MEGLAEKLLMFSDVFRRTFLPQIVLSALVQDLDFKTNKRPLQIPDSEEAQGPQ